MLSSIELKKRKKIKNVELASHLSICWYLMLVSSKKSIRQEIESSIQSISQTTGLYFALNYFALF